jgi:hypothetical protein
MSITVLLAEKSVHQFIIVLSLAHDHSPHATRQARSLGTSHATPYRAVNLASIMPKVPLGDRACAWTGGIFGGSVNDRAARNFIR